MWLDKCFLHVDVQPYVSGFLFDKWVLVITEYDVQNLYQEERCLYTSANQWTLLPINSHFQRAGIEMKVIMAMPISKKNTLGFCLLPVEVKVL